jgi:hypothetical protein
MATMPSPRGKRVAVLVAMGAVIAVGAAVYAFRGPIQEQYWIWRLKRGDDVDKRVAQTALAEISSLAAIPGLLAQLNNPNRDVVLTTVQQIGTIAVLHPAAQFDPMVAQFL